jgi:hypothetical protein
MAAAHTQPTDDPAMKNSCGVSSSPYLSNCQYDGAGAALQAILAGLKPRNDGALSGSLIEFSQVRGLGCEGWDGWLAGCHISVAHTHHALTAGFGLTFVRACQRACVRASKARRGERTAIATSFVFVHSGFCRVPLVA